MKGRPMMEQYPQHKRIREDMATQRLMTALSQLECLGTVPDLPCLCTRCSHPVAHQNMYASRNPRS